MSLPILLEYQGPVLILSLNNQPYNAMTLDTIDNLQRIVADVAENNDIRAVVLTAEGGQNFSVGMDLKQLESGAKAAGGVANLLDQRLRVIAAIESMNKPWIATLFGYCLGGGLEIPLGCHFRLAASEGALIGLPEMDLGSVPAWGGSARLAKIVGRARATDMILRGKKISGKEALEIGLVNEIWPLEQLREKAIELAHQLADQPQRSVQGMLQVLENCEEKNLQELLQLERQAVLKTLFSEDSQEGMQAFIEKRTPKFNRTIKSK